MEFLLDIRGWRIRGLGTGGDGDGEETEMVAGPVAGGVEGVGLFGEGGFGVFVACEPAGISK